MYRRGLAGLGPAFSMSRFVPQMTSYGWFPGDGGQCNGAFTPPQWVPCKTYIQHIYIIILIIVNYINRAFQHSSIISHVNIVRFHTRSPFFFVQAVALKRKMLKVRKKKARGRQKEAKINQNHPLRQLQRHPSLHPKRYHNLQRYHHSREGLLHSYSLHSLHSHSLREHLHSLEEHRHNLTEDTRPMEEAHFKEELEVNP